MKYKPMMILSDPQKRLAYLKKHGVDVDLVTELTGPDHISTAMRMARGWFGLQAPTQLARMRLITQTLHDANVKVDDDDYRTKIWIAARHIEKAWPKVDA